MIVCRIYQWFMGHRAEPSDALRPRLARHLKQCSDCRDYSHRLMRVEEQLRSSPAEMLSPAQHARIQASVLARLREANVSAQRPVQTFRRRPLRLAAGAVAAAAMLVVVLNVFMPKAPSEPLTLATLLASSERFGRQLPQWALLPEQSMQTELQKLASDTQRTVAFLLNCTPSHPGPVLDNGL